MKKYIKIIIFYSVSFIGFITMIIHSEITMSKEIEIYKKEIRESSYYGHIDMVYSRRGATVIRLHEYGNITILPKHPMDKYEPYYFEKIASKGDSISKKANVDTLELFHNGEKISFKIEYTFR